MLRTRNMGTIETFLRAIGAQAVTSPNSADAVTAPFNGVISAIFAKLGTAGVTGTQNTDVQKNGVTVFASGAAALQFATTSQACTYGAFAAQNPPQVNKGDVISLVTTVVHTTPGRDLMVWVVFERKRLGKSQGGTETDTLGGDSDVL